MKFIALTDSETGNKIRIAIHRIESYCEEGEGCGVYTIGDGNDWPVSESIEDIDRFITEAYSK